MIEKQTALPWDDLFFQMEETTAFSGELAQRAYRKFSKAYNALIGSYEANVGQTPKELVWALNKCKLYRYVPVHPAEKRHPVPLLLAYALINKPFIFDLVPGRSFVEYMLEQGFDVYLLDWGHPGPEDHGITFDDYVTQYLRRAVRKVGRISGSKEISLLGYCIGATIAVTYGAVYPDAPLRNLILLTAPIDFEGAPEGSMAVWLEEGRLNIDKLVDTLGNVPGELIRFWAKLLKPMENFFGVYVNLMKMQGDRHAVLAWQAINRWVEDVIPFAGEAFRQFVKVYLRGNKLIRGEHEIDGMKVNLKNISASVLNIVALHDHLVSQSQSERVLELISSEDKQMTVIPATHVGLMISRGARYKLWPEVATWLSERSN
jgi:polyhydroxyalkanoate synthase